MHWNFKKETPYFVLDPEGDGLSYFATTAERDKFAEECIGNYLDDGWDEEVIHVLAGKVTHRATQFDKQVRPSVIDNNGMCENGEYWPPEIGYKCRYELRKLSA